MDELMLRKHRLPEWAMMYLYAAHRLGVSQRDVHAFAASIASEPHINQRMQSLNFALSHGFHLTGVGALSPGDYLHSQAMSYLTHAWNEQGVNYTEQLANAALANLQLEAFSFLEVVADHKVQYRHESRLATPGDLERAVSQGAVVGLDIWRGKLSGTRFLLLGTEGDECYEAYMPSTDLVHYGPKQEIVTNLWPSVTILSHTPLQL